MKKLFILFIMIGVLLSLGISGVAYANAMPNNELNLTAKSAYLVDFDSGTVIYEKDSEKRLPIASMVKIMTLNIIFDNIHNGKLSVEDKISVSQDASAMGGSQMFLDANTQYPVNDLIKGIVVCSANDASYALAETIGGSVDAFIDLMNTTAKKYGMENTNFVNVTGLPKEGQYSTAKDVSIMTRKLLSNTEYYRYSKVFLEDYTHPSGRITQMVNTNKLIRFYQGCDSGKTGFTNDAMFCLSASAKRNNFRIVATVLGVNDSKTRFAEVTKMFNYAYSNYDNDVVMKANQPIANDLTVKRAKVDSKISVGANQDIAVLVKRGVKGEYTASFNMKTGLKAPLKKGEVVGTVTIYTKSKIKLAECDIIVLDDIEEQTYIDSLDLIAKNWKIRIKKVG